jgi:hypothetical protein
MQGTLEGKGGMIYEGEWISNQFNGKGILHSSDGGRYDGRFEKGIKQGYGVQHYFDGTIYKGNWLQGKKDGFGVASHPNHPDSTKEGYWKNDRFLGLYKDENPVVLKISIPSA